MKLRYPFNGNFRITQKFKENPKNYKKFGLAGHEGVDFATPNKTKLLAPMAGKTYVGWAPRSWGLFYSIENNWGTVYLCHLKENYLPTGVEVSEGQLIGETDNTGNSTGPHLHISLRVKGIKDPSMKDFVDPLPYLNGNDKFRLLHGETEVKTYETHPDDTISGLEKKLKTANDQLAGKVLEADKYREELRKQETENKDLVEQLLETRNQRDKAVRGEKEATEKIESLEREALQQKERLTNQEKDLKALRNELKASLSLKLTDYSPLKLIFTGFMMILRREVKVK